MTCTIAHERLERLIEFHGHECPGLAIGVRAAEYALREYGDGEQVDPTTLVAVVETDMCGVDAIQFLTGCTYGKGNLIHKDYGKMAFSFHDRAKGKSLRLLLKPEARADLDAELAPLMKKMADGDASPADKARHAELREALQQRFMALPLQELFDIQPVASPPPRPAKILASLVCETCGESTMESRTRRFAGQTLCIPCFQAVEQKV